MSVTVSPGGSHIYVAGGAEAAVAVFSRDATTGVLTFVEAQKQGAGGVDGLWGAVSVTVSPDGSYVYAAAGSAVVVFTRNAATGALAFLQVVKDGVGGVDGLDGLSSLTVSPDGNHIYVANWREDGVTVFAVEKD